MPSPLSASIDIAAPREQVWRIVSDLKSMGERSPQCHKVISFGTIRRGTYMLNINHEGAAWWPTTAKVVTFHPNQKIAFKILENRTVWSYELEDLDGGRGTRLTERREVPDGTSGLSKFLVNKAFGGEERFERSLISGMEKTLAAIKARAEA